MTDTDRLDAPEPDFLDGARLEYNECKEVRRLLGYLWNATGFRTGNLRVCDLFSDGDPIRDDIARLAIFSAPSDDQRMRDVLWNEGYMTDERAPYEREVIFVYRDDYEAAVRERDELRAAGEAVVDWLGECDHFDHHGNCQTHAIERPCRVAALRAALHREDGT